MFQTINRFNLATIALSMLLATGVFASPDNTKTYTDSTTGMELIFIEGGTFLMGDSTGKDQAASPAHKVAVDDFYIGKFEVTFAQFDTFCTATGRTKPKDEWGRGQQPVNHVSWHDAVAFTTWLSRETGKVFRLPSEAEWEYAVRGGTSTRFWWGNDWQNHMGTCDQCGEKGDLDQTIPVGSFAPNPFGLYDMTGNVYEWCLDLKHADYQGAPTTAKAWIDGGKQGRRIERGGAWKYGANEFTSFARCWDDETHRGDDTGFRVVMEP